MIRAVVYCAEWDHDRNAYALVHSDEPPPTVPDDLIEWWDFLTYRLPPLAGGMRDQPLGWMQRCKLLDRVYRSWRAWMACDKGPLWKEQHSAEWNVVKQTREIVYG